MMKAADAPMVFGTRPASDLTVSFDRDFNRDKPCFPSSIRLEVRGGGAVNLMYPLGLTAPFELHVSPYKNDRVRILGEFPDQSIANAVRDALGPKWGQCAVKVGISR